MRYYDLTIADAKTGEVYKIDPNRDSFVKSKGGSTFTSHPQGIAGNANPGALQVEFDAVVYPFNQSQGATKITVWGVGIGMIGQSAQFSGDGTAAMPPCNFTLRAGMAKGLPLANPSQAGLIIQGEVFQSFGNWQGVNQTLDLIVNPGGTAPDAGFCFFWAAGTRFADAVASVLSQTMPHFQQDITVASTLIIPNDEYGTYDNLQQFAGFILEKSEAIGSEMYGDDYSGVLITIDGDTVRVFDNVAAPRDPTQIIFTDLIGQPTWIDISTISFKTVLRADITVGDYIKLPTQGLASPYVLTTANAAYLNAPARSKSIFQGTFWVQEVHHFASFRDPNADSWVTSFTAVATTTFPASQ